MSLFARRSWQFTANDVIPARAEEGRGSVSVTQDTAMRHSAVWACLRLRSDLISTMPVDVFRRVGGVQVEVPKPPVLLKPGGDGCPLVEWLAASQMDLDRAGNTVGLITARDGMGLPAIIELQPIAEVTVRQRNGRIQDYRISGKTYQPNQVWHERQFVLAGVAVGLSPIAYAAWSIGAYLSEQEFVLDWFEDGTIPAARLKNTERTIPANIATEIKARFKAAVRNRDLFVHGKDWDYELIQAQQAQPQFIDAMQYGVGDVARFFGVPGDLIDAAMSSTTVTYASITQRNLQFLIMHLGPAVVRREVRISEWLPQPRYVKFNTDGLLRLDPQTRAATIQTRIDSRALTLTEARELDNKPPLTEADFAEFDRAFGARQVPTAATGVPA